MGLLSMALGKDSPVAQFVDQNKFAIHGAFSGLANGQNISQGLANAAAGAATGGQQDSAYGLTLRDQQSRLDQIAYDRTLQQNALKLQTQGANATADYLEKSPNPQVQALAAAVRNRTISGADALNMIMKPGQTVQPGESVMVNPMGYNVGATAPAAASAASGSPDPNAPPIQPTQPTQTSGQAALIQSGFTPSFSASGPNTDTSSFYSAVNGAAPATPSPAGSPASAAVPVPQTATSVLPGSQDGSGRLAFAQAPTPAPTAMPAALSPPVAAPAQANAVIPGGPQIAFHAPTSDPLKMSVDERKAFAAAQGLKPGDPGYANFIMTAKLPTSIAETWKPATAADLAAQGISGGDPSVYQISSLGQLKQVTGAISQGNGAAPLGTTGVAAIDPTAPGYTSKTVVGGLTQAAIDQRALDYLTSGTEPPVGRTGLAGAQSSAIANRMAEISPSGNLAANKAQLGSLSGALDEQQKYLANASRSISNAHEGFSQVINAFKGKVNPSQYPTINAMVNAARLRLQPGDISAYNAGLQEVATEYTQVFSRGGQVSDGVRAKAAAIINGDLSISDLSKVLDELQAQGGIVVKGAQNQVKRITGQINGIISGKAPPPPDNTDNATPVTATNPQTGEKLMLQNGAWVPAQ